jgi:hypothetical protein
MILFSVEIKARFEGVNKIFKPFNKIVPHLIILSKLAAT